MGGPRIETDDRGTGSVESAAPAASAPPPLGSVDAVIDEFFLARMPKKHSPHTLAAYRRDLDAIGAALRNQLGRSTAEIAITDLDVRTLRRAFAAISHQSAATVSRTWSTWNQLFTFCVAEQIIPGNPMAAVAKPKVPRSRPKAIAGDESVARLLEAAAAGRRNARDPWPERDFAVIVVLLTCGLRLSELLDLTIRSLDGPSGDRVIGVRGKGNKERTVPLEPEVEHIVVTYLESRLRRFPGRIHHDDPLFVDNRGETMRRGGLQYLVDQLYREAGIRTRVPAGALVHALRHTFATSLARNGASGVELQRLLGHESLATTQRYVDATAREVRAAARANDAYRVLGDLTSPSTDDGDERLDDSEPISRPHI
ncbi:MAG: tyrosine-type recombinase/integrase [Actinomycetota bacterium]